MSDDAFLSRWSRRKRATAHEPEVPPAVEPDAPVQAETADAGAAPPDEAELAAEIAALPDVETITAQTDITGFLRRGVPPVLRQAALRRMWRVNPAIRDYLDPAREYAFDWNVPGGAPGGGMVSQQEAAALLSRVFAPRPRADIVRDAARVCAPDLPIGAPVAPLEPLAAPIDPRSGPGAPQNVAEAGRDAVPRRRHGGATPAWPPGDDA